MDRLGEYELLNAVKPKILKSQYPYNLVDKTKIVFTQKKITIMAKELKAKTGGNEMPVGRIFFYG